MSSVVAYAEDEDVEELDALDARLLEALLELNKTLYWILFINFNSASSFSIDASLIVYGLYMLKLWVQNESFHRPASNFQSRP